jgi:PKD repeat protein
MRIYLSVIFLHVLTLSGIVIGQTPDVHPCHQSEETQKRIERMSLAEKEEAIKAGENLDAFTVDFIKKNPHLLTGNTAGAKSTISYTIPVVFHIIHAGGSENISNEQVEDCIRIMNRDYQKQNADANNVRADFLPIVADVEIQFVLARKDPNGNCTNGITRTFSTLTHTGDGDDRINAVQNAHGNWPGNRYLNVYVAANIGGAAGYTYRPQWGGTGMGNGIHVLDTYVGSIGTGTPYRSRTMTHEVGHWLNLPHTWGGTNSPACDGTETDFNNPCYGVDNCDYDDGVSDTPNTIGWRSCNTSGESCGSLDNVENYMEYSYCSKMFTNGQKARMHAALNSSTGGRSTVVSTGNLTFTGVNQPEVFCKAQFRSNVTEVCVGNSIEFKDDSFYTPTEWTWTFEGGTPLTSNEQNPTVSYNTPGLYRVTLTAGDGVTEDTESINGYIRVLPTNDAFPFMESFENYSNLANSNGTWVVNNPGDNSAWEVYTGAGHTGNKCVRLNNINQTVGGIDELISSAFDLSEMGGNSVTLTFRHSFKQRNSSNDDKLRVLASNNCGESWVTRRTMFSGTMSLGVQSTAWIPTTQSDWVTTHITNISSAYFVDGMRFKFEFQNGGGNNIYLDDINFYVGTEWDEPALTASVNEQFLSNITLFPNPTVGELTVQLNASSASNINVRIYDLSGKELQAHPIKGQQGINNIILDVTNLSNGLYLIELSSNAGKFVKQFVKN